MKKIVLFAVSMLFACTPDQPDPQPESQSQQNTSPSAVIIAPTNSSEIIEGESVLLRGTVHDEETSSSQLLVNWRIDEDIVCEDASPDQDGLTQCEAVLERGDSVVFLEVRDPQGMTASATVEIIVLETAAPTAEIISPQQDAYYYADQRISFQGLVFDADDALHTLVAQWSSNTSAILADLDGSISATGELGGDLMLDEGQHTIILDVVDPAGKTASDSVSITVGPPNSEPLCEILTPANGSVGLAGEGVQFTASASDADIDSEQLSVLWYSDQDGELGASIPDANGAIEFEFSGLTVNRHTISLEVYDELGASCTAEILYTVGTRPSITITSPLANEIYPQGQSLAFSALVSDNEDQPSDLSLEWRLNGTLFSTVSADGSGLAEFSDSSLSYGQHTLVLTATDRDGLSASEQVSFTMNGLPSAPTIAINPNPADTTTDLTALILVEADDPEEDSIDYRYEWLQNNTVQSAYTSSSVPASATTKGDIWELRVTAHDGLMSGASASAQIVIQNTEPNITALTITPEGDVYNDDTLQCSAVAVDPDEIPILEYEWTVGGTVLGTSSILDLSLLALRPEDEVHCTATAIDSDLAADTDDTSKILSNRLPILSFVSVSPDPAMVGVDDLVCEVVATDADGDDIVYDFLWSNSAGFTQEHVGLSANSGEAVTNTFPAEELTADIWTCTVTLDDGFASGAGDSASVTVEEAPITDREGWTLVWQDEFSGTEIDSTKWGFEVNGQGGGNNELQYYTDRVENARIENGALVIEARAESYTGADGTRNYTSARLRTANKGDWTYGRIEARIMLPQGQGIWPAFWMLPTNWVYGGWAASGEIDIMELVGHDPYTVHGTLHYGGPWPQNTYSGDHYTIAESFADDFHIFAVEWEEGEIRWYVDDIHVQTQNSWFSTAGAYPAPFNQNFHILLNVAVGGTWPGNPDATTVFPQQMLVDYVRVYTPESSVVTPDSLTFTVDTSCLDGTAHTVSLTGPWAGNWHPGQSLPATNNGDGTWSVEIDMPSQDLEYLWIVNGDYESLIAEMQNGASCAPVTDYWSYANRVWSVGSSNPTVAYNRCSPCP